jgi:hypothetical protein
LYIQDSVYTGICFIQGSVYTGFRFIQAIWRTKCTISGSDDNINLLISDGDDVGLVSSSVDTTAVVWRYTEGKVIC